MSEEKKKQDERYVKRYDTVACFLLLEIIALALFGIGGATGLSILQIASVFVCLLIFPFIRNNCPENWKKKALLALIPLGILMLLLGFGPFWSKAYYGGNALQIILFGLLTALGGVAFFILGYGVTQVKVAKMKYLVLAILGGLGLYVLIAGGYALIRYGPFYLSKYADLVYYYEGVVFPIAKETKALNGFELIEVSLAYGKIASTLLASIGVSLIPLALAKEKKFFFIVLAFTLLGLLDLILGPYKRGLIIALVVYVIAAIVYLLKLLANRSEIAKKRIHLGLKITFFVLIGLTAVGSLLLIIDASNGFLVNAGIPKISANLGNPDGRIGTIRTAIQSAMFNGTSGTGHSGFSFLSFLFGSGNQSKLVNSQFFEFDVFYQAGFLGYAALATFIFLAIKQSKTYLEHSKDDLGFRMVIISLLIAAFIYLSFNNDEVPMIYSSAFMPLSRNPIAFGLLFLVGILYATPFKEERQ